MVLGVDDRIALSVRGVEGEYPLDVPGHGHEAPFVADIFEAAEQNWRNPSTDLMMPNTGSGVCLRKA
jgi:hypothetical protein